MNPPTEQLVRDYLNRLSVAARHKLDYRDRQALLDQTRAWIESECGGVRRASPVQVRQVLAGLGDPVAVVEVAHARLAAGETLFQRSALVGAVRPAVTARPGITTATSAGVPRPADSPENVSGEMSDESDDVHEVFTIDAVPATETASVTESASVIETAPVTESVPATDPGSAGRQVAIRTRSAVAIGPGHRPVPAHGLPVPASPGSASPGSASSGSASSGSASSGSASSGSGDVHPDGPEGAADEDSRQAEADGSRDAVFAAAMTALPAPTGDSDPGSDDDEPGGNETGEDVPGEPWFPRWWPPRPTVPAAPPRPGRLGRAGARVLAVTRQRKMESVAVVLLAVGGAIFPPVWILGAIFALPSRLWDMRDKWTGLGAPVLLVVVGTVLVIVLGGQHSSIGGYAVEAWHGATLLSRILALLSGVYLGVRLYRGRRTPKEPPWNVPHRFG